MATATGSPMSSRALLNSKPQDTVRRSPAIMGRWVRIGAGQVHAPNRTALSEMIYEARKGGGITTNLAGNHPDEGIAFSPSMGTDALIPDRDFNDNALGAFISKNYEALSQPGMKVGGWFNTEDNMWHLDVSKVDDYSADSIREAQKAEQLAIFDLKTGKEHTIGRVTNGKYEPTEDPEVLFGRAFGKRNG